MEQYKVINDGYEIILHKEIYERETVLAVAYKYNHKFLIGVSPYEEDKVKFTVAKKSGGPVPTEKEIETILAEFIDEQLRRDILAKTQNIRDIVYEKAFSPLKRNKK